MYHLIVEVSYVRARLGFALIMTLHLIQALHVPELSFVYIHEPRHHILELLTLRRRE